MWTLTQNRSNITRIESYLPYRRGRSVDVYWRPCAEEIREVRWPEEDVYLSYQAFTTKNAPILPLHPSPPVICNLFSLILVYQKLWTFNSCLPTNWVPVFPPRDGPLVIFDVAAEFRKWKTLPDRTMLVFAILRLKRQAIGVIWRFRVVRSRLSEE